MSTYLEIIQFVLICLIVFLLVYFLYHKQRKTHLKMKGDHLYSAMANLLKLYPLSHEMYKIPDLDFGNEGKDDISNEGKLLVIQHTLKRQQLVSTMLDLRNSIRTDLEDSGEREFREAYNDLENVYSDLDSVYGKFLKYLQTDYNPSKLKKMYQIIPKGFADENNLITDGVNDIFFGMIEKLRQSGFDLQLKIVDK
ncbi:hypothetical protein LV83_03333 [Algoriphagus yeomjeoni]|uniref:Uncharacterized protein n=2 Tax=Algoriphagus yeomjeoni TaxID=291403 RepID=A0A327PAA8_9BACT|nr:hypothetical protein LV83_03333 [Algoriphagus yeomjeoni]